MGKDGPAGLALAAPQSRWAGDPEPAGPALIWLGTDQGTRVGAENVLADPMRDLPQEEREVNSSVSFSPSNARRLFRCFSG